MTLPFSGTNSGLSPRVRGNQVELQGLFVPVGSIPACAGEPRGRPRFPHPTGVYPRVCGGTCSSSQPRTTSSGLSPRVRGNPSPGARGAAFPRSIPACAGEPIRAAVCGSCARVYPRVCGGTPPKPSVRLPSLGLSPRVRGNRGGGIAPVRLRRRLRLRRLEVYPRVCGGTQGGHGLGAAGQGLSPRVRGNRRYIPEGAKMDGSIPACAGEPPSRFPGWSGPQVYPRVCGGTLNAPANRQQTMGLSPRVRGNQSGCVSCLPLGRSIPACAGEPTCAAGNPSSASVYPRVCGGTV